MQLYNAYEPMNLARASIELPTSVGVRAIKRQMRARKSHT